MKPTQHGDDKTVKCPSCVAVFATNASMRQHLRAVHLRNNKCDTFGSKFGTKELLQGHMSKHQGSKQHSCASCGKMYASGLARHKVQSCKKF